MSAADELRTHAKRASFKIRNNLVNPGVPVLPKTSKRASVFMSQTKKCFSSIKPEGYAEKLPMERLYWEPNLYRTKKGTGETTSPTETCVSPVSDCVDKGGKARNCEIARFARFATRTAAQLALAGGVGFGGWKALESAKARRRLLPHRHHNITADDFVAADDFDAAEARRLWEQWVAKAKEVEVGEEEEEERLAAVEDETPLEDRPGGARRRLTHDADKRLDGDDKYSSPWHVRDCSTRRPKTGLLL